MKFKRTISIGFLSFIASLIANAIAARYLGIDIETIDPVFIPSTMWLVGIIAAVIFSAAGTWWFFRSPKIPATATNGFRFGATLSILGFVLDILAFLPLKNGVSLLIGYYSKVEYWTAFILIVVSSTLIGKLKSKIKALN